MPNPLPRRRETAADFLTNAIAPNSARAFKKDIERFVANGGVVPSTPQAIADYIAGCAATHKASTLVRWVASISKAHALYFERAGGRRQDNPSHSWMVRDTLRGIKNKYGATPRRVAPAMTDEVKAMVNHLPAGLAGARDRALLLIGFAGAMRRSELAALSIDRIVADQRGMRIALGKTKTDPTAENDVIAIPVATRDKQYCPVAAYRLWLREAKLKDGPLFRRISKAGTVHPRDSLNPASIAKIIKACAARCGLDASRYSGHSLRAGLATSSSQQQKTFAKIKAQTRHRSDATLLVYIRDGELFLNNAADLL